MKIHNIKILEEYARDVLAKRKTFEIRYNDRDYQVGDIIIFVVVDTNNKLKKHSLNNAVWKITYILDDFYGLRNDYIAMSIEEMSGIEILLHAQKLYAETKNTSELTNDNSYNETELKSAYVHSKETQ